MKEVIINWAGIDEIQEKYFHPQELVRCKDCKHYQGLAECELIGACMGTLGYCAWGKRKEK